MKTLTEDLGNNEIRKLGVFNYGELGYLALSRTDSQWFKTERGAENWIKRNFPDLYTQLTKD
jgi:hypothetical protein